ncbi:SCO family protein [Compostibacter hankyongensis]|uniref:SCO family protein n=1 Tax=Compostibacter hankyongensis TaxID=1007089 RepID=A0ABP8FDV9_9BACT
MICYLIVRQISATTVRLPGYYIVDRVDSTGQDGRMQYDTVYHQLGDFRLTNQLGHPVSLTDVEGKVLLADFFFTSCPSICPRLSANMRRVQQAFAKNDSSLQLLSFTVDPEHDSVPKLKAYADQYGANHDTWWFLTGSKKTIYGIARNDFHLSVSGSDGDAGDFIHTEKWVLLDKHRYIRGYYNGLDTADITRCINDIALLMLEKEKR